MERASKEPFAGTLYVHDHNPYLHGTCNCCPCDRLTWMGRAIIPYNCPNATLGPLGSGNVFSSGSCVIPIASHSISGICIITEA